MADKPTQHEIDLHQTEVGITFRDMHGNVLADMRQIDGDVYMFYSEQHELPIKGVQVDLATAHHLAQAICQAMEFNGV